MEHCVVGISRPRAASLTIWCSCAAQLKEAICTLSPIIRNRIRGLPAYVLAYSDLIPSNSVEKPFLKPVMIAGPSCTEKTELIHMLVKEFPDVFGFATLTTTQREDEWEHRVADDFDVRSMYANKVGCGPNNAVPFDLPR